MSPRTLVGSWGCSSVEPPAGQEPLPNARIETVIADVDGLPLDEENTRSDIVYRVGELVELVVRRFYEAASAASLGTNLAMPASVAIHTTPPGESASARMSSEGRPSSTVSVVVVPA